MEVNRFWGGFLRETKNRKNDREEERRRGEKKKRAIVRNSKRRKPKKYRRKIQIGAKEYVIEKKQESGNSESHILTWYSKGM